MRAHIAPKKHSVLIGVDRSPRYWWGRNEVFIVMSILIPFVRQWENVSSPKASPVPAVHITYRSSTNNSPTISVACGITKLGGGGIRGAERPHCPAKGHY